MEKTTTIRVDKDQSNRAKKLKDAYRITVKEIFEKGLLFYENDKKYEYYLLLDEKKNLETDLISQKAKIEHKRRELMILADNYHDAINDILFLWKESKKDLDTFCNKEKNPECFQYLAKNMGEYEEISNLEVLKKVLKEKKNF